MMTSSLRGLGFRNFPFFTSDKNISQWAAAFLFRGYLFSDYFLCFTANIPPVAAAGVGSGLRSAHCDFVILPLNSILIICDLGYHFQKHISF